MPGNHKYVSIVEAQNSIASAAGVTYFSDINRAMSQTPRFSHILRRYFDDIAMITHKRGLTTIMTRNFSFAPNVTRYS